MRFAIQRQKQIIKIIEEQGAITVEEISSQFKVSKMTAWRDLKQLEMLGAVQKVHGGAVQIMENQFDVVSNEVPYLERTSTNQETKRKLARYTAEHFIKDGDILFLDGGTTVIEMLPYITQNNVTIISNGLYTLNEATKYMPHLNVVGIGGEIRDKSFTFVGHLAKSTIGKFNSSAFFTSGTGFSIENGIMDPDLLEMEIKQVMAENSDKIIAIMDSSKFGKQSMTTSLVLSEIDVLIVDSGIKEQTIDDFKEIGVNLIIV